jgi:hypothetical protein
MAKGAPKGTGAPPKTAAPSAGLPAANTPKTTGAAIPGLKNQKQAAGQPGDIGDICLLPDIARFAH